MSDLLKEQISKEYEYFQQDIHDKLLNSIKSKIIEELQLENASQNQELQQLLDSFQKIQLIEQPKKALNSVAENVKLKDKVDEVQKQLQVKEQELQELKEYYEKQLLDEKDKTSVALDQMNQQQYDYIQKSEEEQKAKIEFIQEQFAKQIKSLEDQIEMKNLEFQNELKQQKEQLEQQYQLLSQEQQQQSDKTQEIDEKNYTIQELNEQIEEKNQDIRKLDSLIYDLQEANQRLYKDIVQEKSLNNIEQIAKQQQFDESIQKESQKAKEVIAVDLFNELEKVHSKCLFKLEEFKDQIRLLETQKNEIMEQAHDQLNKAWENKESDLFAIDRRVVAQLFTQLYDTSLDKKVRQQILETLSKMLLISEDDRKKIFILCFK